MELNAPIKASAGGVLKGQGGGFFGELSVGVGIEPTIDLDIIPYIKGEIPQIFAFEEDLDRFEQPLGSIFKFEWGSTYGFGDTEYRHQAPIQPMTIPAPSHKETKHEGRSRTSALAMAAVVARTRRADRSWRAGARSRRTSRWAKGRWPR